MQMVLLMQMNNPNMDANAINGMANQVNTTKAALNGAQNLAQAKTTDATQLTTHMT
ncbi:hypothetical protein ACVNPX_02255 [Staphylococcus aureus]